MLMEGFVSMMALIAACILIPGDYFAINSTLSTEALTGLGFPPERIKEFSDMVGTNVQGRPGGAVSLAVGMASIFSALPGMKGLMAYWYNFALMFEALFIMTALDTGTRVARFLLQEMGGLVYKPLRVFSWMPGTIITSFVAVAAWGWLIYTGSIATIWPMFGVANQLLAALALTIGTTILLKTGKLKYIPITAVPMVFMYVTTFTAAFELVGFFWRDAGLYPDKAFVYRLDAALVSFMTLLTVIILIASIFKWRSILSERRTPSRENI
jgi:carbon starvation protein